MLPLEGIFLVPSLFITPAVVAVLFVLRRGESHAKYWRAGAIVCFLLTAFYTILVLSTPLYSQRDHTPDNPGGFSVGVWAVLAELVLWICIVIPAFPVLVALACIPPRGRSRMPLAMICGMYVVVLVILIWWKNVRFTEDFEQTKIRERADRIESRENMRRQWQQR